MTLVLNGSVGVSDVDGSAATPAIRGTDANTGMFFPAADTIAFAEGGAEVMRLDSAGNVGIGGTPFAGARLDVFGAGTQRLYVRETGSSVYGKMVASTSVVGIGSETNHPLLFNTNDVERARITSGGNFGIGTTAPGAKLESSQSSAAAWNITGTNPGTSGQQLGALIQFTGYSPNDAVSYFYYGTDNVTVRFAVASNGGIFNYQANNSNLSDARLKKNVHLSDNYLDKICAIPVKTFLYNDQTDNELNLGVIAQDVEAVAPELVDKDGWVVKAPDGSNYLSIYQTDLQYALMKCIQELKAENDALKARVEALENV